MKKWLIILIVTFAGSILQIEPSPTAFSQSEDEALKLYKKGDDAIQYGRYQEALEYYEQSLKIGRALNYQKAIAANLNNIGMVYDSLGRYEDALKYHGESLKIMKELNIPQDIATSLNNIGMVYNSLGRYKDALKYHEESLKIRKELNIPQDIAMSFNNMGLIYDSLGRYEDALRYYEEALKIRKELNIPQVIATSLNNIGAVYKSLGRYEDALKYYEESLKIKRELNLPEAIATSLNNIGVVYDSVGRYENALKYFEESLKIKRELNIPQDIATSLDNIGMVYISLKDYIKAEKVFKEAEVKKQSIGLKRNINHSMVELFLATKRYDEALRMLEKGTPSLSDTPGYQIQYFTQRGRAFKGIKSLKEASRDFHKAAVLIEEMRADIKGEKAGFLAVKERIEVYQGLFSSLSERVLKGEKKDTDFNNYGKDLASAAFYFTESTKARILLEAMAESARKSHHVGISEEFREKEQSLLNQISAIDAQWEETYKKGEDALKAFKKRRDGLTAELNILINELRQKYPAYTALYYPKPIPPEELPLRDNEILLEYAMSDDACYLFVVRKGGVKSLLRIPFGKEALESKVQEFVDSIKNPVHKKFSTKMAKELYDILLAQPLKDVKGGDKVIIIPDGILGVLPFESLVIKEGSNINDSIYVEDKYTLSYYQSASVLSLMRHLKQANANKVFFALGNPVYTEKDERYIAYKQGKTQPITLAQNVNQASYRSLASDSKWGKTLRSDKDAEELVFPPLPETEDEVKAIAKLFGIQPKPLDVLLGINANETQLRKSPLKDYRYLHFATHADLPGKVQGIKEPFLLLGQVENKGGDDGFLTMSEVLDLDLNADMVVLSACLTGRGNVMEGEGVMNFARAFQHAGAMSVMVSLWEVASKEAVEYMEIFYRHLKGGKDRAEALNLARKEIKSKYPHPFYWSVFVLYGEG